MDVSALDAITGGGDDAFTWLGDGAFTGAAGQLHYRHVIISTVAFTLVEADMNGDKVSDFEVEIMSHLTLRAGDFIL
jgi:serralysin